MAERADTPPRSPRSERITRVDAARLSIWPNWKELWEFRTTLYFLTMRDLKIRYKQTVLGVSWAILQPVLTMIVFTIFFGGIAKIPTPNGLPYALFSYAALVPWTFFANGVTLASDSLVGQAHLVRKVFFPRLIVPLGRILGGMIDFLLALAVLFVLMALFGYAPRPVAIIALPLLTLLAFTCTFAVSLWLSALNVGFRDVRYLVPFMVQILMYASPVVYSSSLLEEPLRTVFAVNPMVTVVEGFRWALLGTEPMSPLAVLLSVLVTLIILLTGLMFFSRAEGTFSDII